ncbi:MAG: RNA polymerase sigma factor [Bacteroidales bacterium]|jgi:RNA polymerase sigma factor (sigma-70 family)|nr:RNA polymerase sigma factor [Bacteroidales bacterium]MEE3407413.1 RNA polymerase sigma factor [Candidatus Cryptobacteroides sp.]SKC37662.1 RNA polymerase sigma-70 factor, ECF subfamily [Bacteroidales bacterium WCE2008]MBO7366141.1 RNA polymerase sigma factor [Bacteroidales bacterium]MBP5235883.1 RNA polymerase sigma factor [Bacteroidales bacterium]
MSDKEIISLWNSGQHERAFNEIVSGYSERLYWHVRRFTCCHEDTDDLLQEIFVKIWAALPSFRGEAQLFTWIYRIATNETLNFLRRQKLRSLLSSGSLTAELERLVDDDPYFNGDEAQRLLLKAVQKLPTKQRLVFTMRYFEDLKYEDISEIMDTSVSSLKASYHFAYEKMKAILKENF